MILYVIFVPPRDDKKALYIESRHERQPCQIWFHQLSLQIACWDFFIYIYMYCISNHMYIYRIDSIGNSFAGTHKYPQISQSPIWPTWHLNGFHVKKKQTIRLGEGYRSSTQLQEAQGGGEGWFEGIFCCGFSSVGSEEETRRGPIFFLLRCYPSSFIRTSP